MSEKRYLFYISQNYSYAILRPLQEVIWARGDETAWFIEGEEVNEHYLLPNERLLPSIAAVHDFKPRAIFYPANTAPTFLPGINVAIFHGFDAGKRDNKGNSSHFKIRNCFDLYCTQGPNTTSVFKRFEQQNDHFKVIETGWCALDPIYSTTPNKVQSKKTVLFCSTFSKKLSSAPHLFDTIKTLSRTGKWNWLVQLHPKMPQEIVEQYKSIQNQYLTFVETDDVIPLLQQADVMVCDTSSVLIMFLLLAKPVVTFNNIAPKDYLLNIVDTAELEHNIDKALQYPPELMAEISSFIENTHPYKDGNSSVRVLNAVEEVISGKFSLAKKPFDFFRQFKMRSRLKYWTLW